MEVEVSAPVDKCFQVEIENDVTVEILKKEISLVIKYPIRQIQLYHEDVEMKPEMVIEKGSHMKLKAQIKLDATSPDTDSNFIHDDSFKKNVSFLTNMGFPVENAESALIESKNSVETAISYLLPQSSKNSTEVSNKIDEDSIKLYDSDISKEGSTENLKEIPQESSNTSVNHKTISEISKTTLKSQNNYLHSSFSSIKNKIFALLDKQIQNDGIESHVDHVWTQEEDELLTIIYKENETSNYLLTTLQDAFPDIQLYEIRNRVKKLNLETQSLRSEYLDDPDISYPHRLNLDDGFFLWKLVLSDETPEKKFYYMKTRFNTLSDDELHTIYENIHEIIMSLPLNFEGSEFIEYETENSVPRMLLLQIYLTVRELDDKWDRFAKIFPNIDQDSLKSRIEKLLIIDAGDLQPTDVVARKLKSNSWPTAKDQQLIDLMTTKVRIWDDIYKLDPERTRSGFMSKLESLFKGYIVGTRPDLTFPIEFLEEKLSKEYKHYKPKSSKVRKPTTEEDETNKANGSGYNKWLPAEDEELRKLYNNYKNDSDKWKKILQYFPSRSRHSVYARALRTGMLKNQSGDEEESEQLHSEEDSDEKPTINSLETDNYKRFVMDCYKPKESIKIDISPIKREKLVVKYLKKISKKPNISNDSFWDKEKDKLLLDTYVKGEDIYELFNSISKIAVSSRLKHLMNILSNLDLSEESNISLSDDDRIKIGLPVFNFKMKKVEEESHFQNKLYDLSEVVID